MGQKTHPTGFRLTVRKDWTSRWYANKRNFAKMVIDDIKVRKYLTDNLPNNSAVSKIVIERPAKSAVITIHSGRPGVIIGKKGEDLLKLSTTAKEILGVPVTINIEEVRRSELDAQLVADSITSQLEKRSMFRRVMKRCIQNGMKAGAKGIKIASSGRLNGIEIARSEWYREGRVPLHSLKADIKYGFSTAKTVYGIIGVKVWIYLGDLSREFLKAPPQLNKPARSPDKEERRSRPHARHKPMSGNQKTRGSAEKPREPAVIVEEENASTS